MNKTWLRDAFERVVATFIMAALAVWIAADGADMFSATVAEGAAVAGLAAAGSVLKALIASRLGSSTSASLDAGLVVVEAPPAGPDAGRVNLP